MVDSMEPRNPALPPRPTYAPTARSSSRSTRVVASQLAFDLKPTFMPARPQEVHLATCSADRARARLGYATKFTLDQGLATMIEYIKTRGPRPFKYHVPLEIVNERTPETWRKQLM